MNVPYILSSNKRFKTKSCEFLFWGKNSYNLKGIYFKAVVPGVNIWELQMKYLFQIGGFPVMFTALFPF